MVLLEEIVSCAAELDRIQENLKSLQTELKNVRKTIQEKIQPLEARRKELDQVLLDYLEQNQLPGVKLNGTMFMKYCKPVYKSKQAKIEEVLKKEPPGNKPELMTLKILEALNKRCTVETADAEADAPDKVVYVLKIIRS